MKKAVDVIANIFAIIWLAVILVTILFDLFGIIGVFFGDIMGMIKAGVSLSTVGFLFLFLSGIVFAVTGWIPVFRRCYYMLPWLYPLCMRILMHLFNLSLAECILCKGFAVMNPTRHTVTIIFMIIQLVGCRALMCIYLKKHPS